MQSLARGECRDCAAIERRKVAGENRWRVFGDASCGASFDLETQSVIKSRCFSEVERSGTNCKRVDTNLSVCRSSSPSAINGHQAPLVKVLRIQLCAERRKRLQLRAALEFHC